MGEVVAINFKDILALCVSKKMVFTILLRILFTISITALSSALKIKAIGSWHEAANNDVDQSKRLILGTTPS